MRIQDAKQAYTAHLDTLLEKKERLTNLLKDSECSSSCLPDLDRVDLSRELSEIDAEYKATQKIMDHIIETENIIYNNNSVKQQSEAAIEGIQELGRLLTIYRRIASGAKVPSRDEYKLMEFSHELYFAAKAAASFRQDNDEEYDSLWKNEKKSKEPKKSPEDIAADTQIAVPNPQRLSAIISVD